MPRKLVDKAQCRYCRNREPLVTICRVHGSMTGECRDCYRSRQSVIRLRKSFHLDLYRSTPELVNANVKVLYSHQVGTYAIRFRPDKALAGFVAIKHGMIFVNIFGGQNAFQYDLFGVASFIGNQNCFIAEPFKVIDANGNAVPLDAIGNGFPIHDVQTKLVWYDKALQDKAVKVIRDEITDAKKRNMAKAQAVRNAERVQKTPSGQ